MRQPRIRMFSVVSAALFVEVHKSNYSLQMKMLQTSSVHCRTALAIWLYFGMACFHASVCGYVYLSAFSYIYSFCIVCRLVLFSIIFFHVRSSFGTFYAKCTCSRTLILVTSDKINMIATLFSKLAKQNTPKNGLCGTCVPFGIECAYLLLLCKWVSVILILWFGFVKATGNFESQKIQWSNAQLSGLCAFSNYKSLNFIIRVQEIRTQTHKQRDIPLLYSVDLPPSLGSHLI